MAAAVDRYSNWEVSHISTQQDDVIALLQQQHTQIKDLLHQVETASFAAKFHDFAESVIEHAEMEEKERKKRSSLHYTQACPGKSAPAVRVAEAVAPTRPHPHAGESATANVVFGPPLALFDRVRDAVRDWRTQSEKPPVDREER
ncbi:hypothetical protein ACFRAQ_15960 [Nocardia sp. NPDC056611]|uniref:hypothetical protein n=1 Tax=Nocardia sp. NPDC056611 TaxID=3345877 RepID=UPI0036707016